MNCRQAGFLGIGAWVLFWTALVVFASFRPAYSHVLNTVSELGAIGTPYATAWNILGFIIPGILFGIVGAVIARTAITQASTRRTLATILFVVCGLGVVGQGVMPAEMSNGVANIASTSTRGHFISSLISGVAWAVGAFMLVGPMRRSPSWRRFYIVNLMLVLLTLIASIVLRGVIPDGLAERIGDGFFCAWFVVMSLELIRLDHQIPGINASVGTRGSV